MRTHIWVCFSHISIINFIWTCKYNTYIDQKQIFYNLFALFKIILYICTVINKYNMKYNNELLDKMANGTLDKVDSHTKLDNIIYRQIDYKKKGGTIHIKPENKGKFTATKKRTGKTTEELTHSKNPLTRKRAVFAQNARRWAKKKK